MGAAEVLDPRFIGYLGLRGIQGHQKGLADMLEGRLDIRAR